MSSITVTLTVFCCNDWISLLFCKTFPNYFCTPERGASRKLPRVPSSPSLPCTAPPAWFPVFTPPSPGPSLEGTSPEVIGVLLRETRPDSLKTAAPRLPGKTCWSCGFGSEQVLSNFLPPLNHPYPHATALLESRDSWCLRNGCPFCSVFPTSNS